MADFTTINQEIDNNIKQNGVNAITGQKLNTVLKDMMSAVNTEKQDTIDDLAEIRTGAEAGAAAYQMPEEGIPSRDLSEGVQKSLENADNAVLYEEQSTKTDQQRNTALANVSNQTANSTTGKMGYKVLDGSKSFASQVTAENTIYEIRDVFDINGSEVIMPSNCVLNFEGGRIIDGQGSGKITLNDTYLGCETPQIGIITCDIDGTYTNNVVFPEWLVDSPNSDFSNAIQTLINCTKNGVVIKFTGVSYSVTPEITMKSNVTLFSDNRSKITTAETSFYRAMFRNIEHCDNIAFEGLSFEQTATSYTLQDGHVGRLVIGSYDTDGIVVKNCRFLFNGTNCISVNGANCRGTIIAENEFVFKRVANLSNYDVSHVYVADHGHIITGNRIYGYNDEIENRAGGAIESHGVSGIVSDNNINNVKACVNVVNDITPNTTDSIVRQISGNVCDDIDTFVALWPITTSGKLQNVSISNNIATNIKVSAVCSVNAQGTEGEIEGLSISSNTFSGLFNNYSGNDFNPNLDDIANLVAFKFYTKNNVSDCHIFDNIIRNFPGTILHTMYYTAGVSDKRQHIEFVRNLISGCFNGEITYDYPGYYSFALFYGGKYCDLEILENVIEIPNDTKIPPILCASADVGRISFKKNFFNGVETKMVFFNENTMVDFDILKTRTIPQMFVSKPTSQMFIVGDNVGVYSKIEVCTQGGRATDVTMSNSTVNLLHGVGYYVSDNEDQLENGDKFKVTFGTATDMQEEIACVCNGKIYTNRWRTLSSYFGAGTSQYSVTPTFIPAVFANSSIDNWGTGPTIMERGMAYYSKGLNRPLWKGASNNWLDAFGHESADFSGTLANRPNGASLGHIYMTTDSGDRRPLFKSSSSGDNWVDAFGWNGVYKKKGATTERPSATASDEGYMFYDSTLKKMILWNGTAWVNLDGTALS